MEYRLVLALIRALNEHQVEYVIVGAVAMGLQGVARGTDDIDLFVRPTADNIARLRQALSSVWPDPAIEEISESDLAGDVGMVTYVPPKDEITIDFISRLGEAFRFDDIEWEEAEAGEGVLARVATPRMIYRMKRDTLRPQDRADAHALQERFQLGED